MVVGAEEDVSLEADQVVVERLDALQVEVVGRRVENQTVGVLQLHTCNHAAHLLASGEHVHLLFNLFLLEEHAPEKSLHGDLVARPVLRQPVDEVQVAVEEPGVVQREIGRGDGHAPVVSAAVSLAVAVDDFEEGRHCLRITGKEDDLLPFLDVEVHVVEQYRAVGIDSLQVLHFKDLIARFALHAEDDAWVLAARRAYLLDVQAFQHLLA